MLDKMRSKRKYRRSLDVLLKRIDNTVDEYVENGRENNTYKDILYTPDCLNSLLYDLHDYHPLSWPVRWHGKRVYSRIFLEFENPKKDYYLEERVKEAFQLRSNTRDGGVFKRDLKRICVSIFAPVEYLVDKIMVLYAMIVEMRRK